MYLQYFIMIGLIRKERKEKERREGKTDKVEKWREETPVLLMVHEIKCHNCKNMLIILK